MSDDDMVRFGDKIEIDMDGMSEPAKASLRAAVEEADSMGDELKRLADAYNALLEEAEMKNMLLREKEGVIEDLRRAEADDVGSLKKRQGAVINDLRNALEAKEAASHQQAQELQMVQHEAFTLQNAVSALKMEGRETDQEHSREVEDLSMRISRLSAEASEKTSTITAMNFEHRTLTDNALMQQKENADLRRIIGKLKADLELTKRNNDNDERSLHHEVDHLRGVLERMEKSRADLECEASEARLRERQLANTADKLQGDLNCAKLRHSTEMEGARRVWDDEKRLLERNIMDRKEEAAMLDANAARNRREIQNLYQELDDARDQCAEAERRERERKAEVDRLQEDMRALSQMMRSETTRLQDEAEEAAMKQRHSALQLQQAKGEISTLKNEKSVLELAQSELELDNTRLAEDVERLKRELDATRQCEAKLRVEVKKLEMILSQKDALNESLRRKLHEGVRGMAAERQDVEKLTDAMQKVTDRLRVANLEIEEIFVNDGDNDEEGTGGDDEETGQGTSSASIFGQSRADLSRAGNLQQSMADLRAAFDEDHDEYEPACLPDEVAKVEGFGDQLLALIQMHKWEHQDRVQSSKDDMSSMLDQKNAAIKNLEDQIRMMQGELRQLHASTAAAHEMEQAEEMDRRVIDRQEHAEFATIEMQKREADHYLTRQRMHALEDWEARARRQVVEGEAAAFNAILLNRDLKYERQRANAAENMLLLMQQEERARAAIKEAEDTAANAFGGSIAVVKTMHGEARKRNLEGEEEELRDDINDHENADREMLVLQFKLEEEKRKVEEGLRMRRAMQDKHELVGWEEAERRDIQDDEERCFEVICECVAGVKVQYITGLIYELEYDEANARLDIEDLEEGEWNLILHDADLDFEQMIEKLRKKRLRELRAKQKKTAYMGIQVSDGITIRGASGTETHFREREQVSKLLKEGVPVKGLNKHAAAQRSMEGVKVFNVAPNGPSDLAGISSDDVILSFNGLHTRGLSDFKSVAKKVKPGEIVNFTVWREGEEVAVPVQTVEVNEDDFEQGLRRKIGHRITVMRGMKEERTRQREARRRELRVDRVPAVHTSVPRDHVIDPAATHSLAGANAGPMTNGMFVRSKRLNQALAADYHDEMAAEDAPAERPLTACPPSPRETRGSNISPQPHLSKPKLWRK